MRTRNYASDLALALDALNALPRGSLDQPAIAALDTAERAIKALGDIASAEWAVCNQPTISVPQYAMLIGIDRITAYEHVKTGDVPSIKIGRRVRIPAAVARRQLGIEDK
ncbi:helix-turn-helix domain-containing protein [Gordonia sp. NB41Y]|uniref:helix-turn-helix domain-containing protein n=1 Tax=Gordonia sp. NB41Y TaxID=875808 RepID=UPI00128FB1B0|nr:helix-turn-helix domain-containing protein [Gordonia sp. NB41Y]WLP89947.1 helix-turn-helix domain-containing protein [Gordonia sp. NB41Y]